MGNESDFFRAYNTLSQRIMGNTKGTATAKFEISNMAPGQCAGFVRFGGVYHLFGVYVNEDGVKTLFFQDNDGVISDGKEISSDKFYVRTFNNSDQASFEYSFDREVFERFGPVFTVEFGKWTGDRLGFFCWNKNEEKGFIDVDWFTYTYDGPKAN